MVAYITRRLFFLVPTLLGVTLIAFLLSRVVPGDPALMIAGEQATVEDIENVRTRLGLDQPLHIQYVRYMAGLAQGDLGNAWHTSHSVAEDLKSRFPATLELTLLSLVIAIGVALPVGVISAVRKDGLFDQIARVTSMLGASVPIFWLGLLAIYFFYFKLHWAPPPMGRLSLEVSPPPNITGLYLVDSLLSGEWDAFRSALQYLILPAIVLSSGAMAIVTRMTRAAVLEVVRQDYVRTARAKGLAERRITMKHVLRNAMIPVVTILGLQFGHMLGGAVITETVFNWPGMGGYATESVLLADYAPVQGFILVAALIYAVVNLVVDLIYAAIDPRIRYN